MRCDSCYGDIHPVVLVDIDGTLAEYHDALTEFVNHYFDLPLVKYAWNGEGDFEDYFGITQEQYREAKLAFRQGGMKRSMAVYPYVNRFMQDLSRVASVWLTTTRPWQRLDNVDPDTREWLRRNNIQYDGLLYDEFKYSKILDIIDRDRIVGVIEDLPEQYDHAEEMGLPVFQVVRLHNSHPTQQRPTRGTLPTATAWVNRNLTEWRNRNESRS